MVKLVPQGIANRFQVLQTKKDRDRYGLCRNYENLNEGGYENLRLLQ